MIPKNFSYLILILISLILQQFNAFMLFAQKQIEYSQVDTVIISESPESKTFIIKAVNSEIESEYYDNKLLTNISIYNFPNGLLVQTIHDTSESFFSGGWIKYVDINFDRYLDIDIELGYHNLIPFHSFWIFNPKENEFFYSREFSQLNDYYVYVEEKIINSSQQSLGGRGGYLEKYKIENDSLILIETSSLDYYDYERSELVDGELKTVELTSQEWVTDSNDNQLIVLNQYKLIDDSLLIVKKNWLIEFKDKINRSIHSEDIYECGYLGYCLKYLKKEVYFYEKDKNGTLIKFTKKYQVINNKWEKIDESLD